MSETEVKPETPPAPEKPKLTVRSAVTIMGVVVGGAAVIGLLAAGGWIATAAVPVAAVGAGYTRHRMKNPRRPSGRRSTNEGKPAWPLTGSQSRRALLKSGKSGPTRASKTGTGTSSRRSPMAALRSPRGRSTASKPGTRGSGTPARTATRSKGRTSAGGALPTRKATRPVPSTTGRKTRTSSAGDRPPRRPKTPSRTPAKPGSASRLTGSRPSARKPSTSRPSTRKAGRRGSGGKSSRPSLRKGSTPGRSSTHRRPGIPGGLSGRSPSGRSRVRRSLGQLKRRTTATRGLRRGRTTSPDALKRIPNRTAQRPRSYKRASASTLWRLALGIPIRSKKGLKRPTAAQKRKARRTLRLRSLTRLWGLRRLPGRVMNAHWDRIFRRIPQPPPKDGYPVTVPEPKAKAQPGPVHVITFLPQKENSVSSSMGPYQAVTDAFNQLAAFQPESAGEMDRFLAYQHEMFQEISGSYTTLADRMQSEMPYGASSADATRDLGAAFGGLANVAQDVYQAFREEHADELARLENPRPDEGQWDTGRQ